MAKNEILEHFKKEVAQSGVPIEIAGRALLVMRPSRSETLQAIGIAKTETDTSQRSGLVLGDEQLKKVREIFPEIDLSKRGQKEWATDFLSHFSKALIPLVVRKTDGNRLAGNRNEAKLLVDLVSQIPGAEDLISNAMMEAQKKSLTTESK